MNAIRFAFHLFALAFLTPLVACAAGEHTASADATQVPSWTAASPGRSYRPDPPRHPRWHAYFTMYQPTPIVWGEDEQIDLPAGALPCESDLPKAQVHMFDDGHFVLGTDGADIAVAVLSRDVLGRTETCGKP